MTAPTINRLFSRRITRTLLTPHPVEHYIRSLGVTWSDDSTGATVVSVDRPVPDVTVLTLRLPAGVDRPAPGAALQIGVVVNGVIHRRHYSPVDPASREDRLATIAVRRHPGGVVSEHLWAEAAPGMRLLLGDPVGEIALPEERPADVLLVSGGSGITPMLSIASTLAAERHPGRVAWLHYARRAGDVPFADRIEELSRAGVDVQVVETAGEASPAGLSGHLTPGHLESVAPWHADATVFLCGPEGLAEGLREALGADRYSDVLRERFSATTGPVPEGDGGTVFEVECRERVYRASSAGESLADATAQVFWSAGSCLQARIRLSIAAPPVEGAGAVQEFDPATSQMVDAAPAGEPISLTRIYAGPDGFAKLIEEFAGGSRVFAVEDFRESYSPAQWTQLRPKLDAAGFRGVRVFLKVDLSDEMKRYLGASTAHAEVPSEILE